MTNNHFKIKVADTLTAEAYNKIEEMIVSAELEPGSFVSENELSTILGIGRTPVREALKKLENTHLVSFVPRKGIQIRVVSVDELLLQLEVRTVLERLVVERATKYASKQEREFFNELAKEYRIITKEWQPAVNALRVDNTFNHFLCKVSRNPFLADALLPMHAMARRQYYCNYFIDKELTAKVNNSHADLMEAIAKGDVPEALHYNDLLLSNVKEFNSMSLATWFPQIDTSALFSK